MFEDGLDYSKKIYPEFNVEGKKINPSNTELKVVIATYGREDKQKVYYQFPEKLRKEHVFLATREDRYDLLKKHNPDANIIKLSNTVEGIAATRQACIEAMPKGKVWMVDDLVKLQKKDKDLRVIGKASDDEVIELYNAIDYLLDHYAMVGVSGRPGNDKYQVWKRDIVRIYACYGMRTDIFEDIGLKFTGMYEEDNSLWFMEDFYLVLSLLTKGYSDTCIWDFIAEHNHNCPGGNSIFRNPEINAKCWRKLKEKFPKYVKLKTVEGNSWGKGMDCTRIEGMISWKKSFAESQAKKEKKLF